VNDLFFSPGRHHAVWKEWRRIGKGKEELFFLEHRQAVLESLSGPRPPRQVLLARELYAHDPARWDTLARSHRQVRWFLLDGAALDAVASVPAHSGLCAVYERSPSSLKSLLSRRFLLLSWELSDPGNLGTIVRVASGLGDGGLLALGGCDPWSAKVARASAGALLQAQVARLELAEAEAALDDLQAAGFTLYGAFPQADLPLQQLPWSPRSAVLLGNETRGLPLPLANRLQPFCIPTSGQIESLNVAMSAAIVAWEWRRTIRA
jgi:TrmH family RNA methyltransferase